MLQRNAPDMRRAGTRVCACLLACLFAAAAIAQEGPPSEGEPPPVPAAPEATGMQGTQGMGGMQMSCCPPSAMSKMADKPAGMVMMMVCGFLVAALLASIIAVLIALTIFLIRRSRVPVVAV